MKSPRLLAAGFLALALAAIAAAAPSRFNGHWQIDIAQSTPIRPWDQAQLEIKADADSVQIVRHLRWGLDRKVDDTTNVKTDGKTVTANPIGYWLDTWYTNVYIGGDHQKQVIGEWLDDGRVLKVESRLALEAQQGDHAVHIYEEYRLSADGNTLTMFALRSTRDQAMTYIFHRIHKFAEPAGMTATASGLRYAVLRHGTGPLAQPGQVMIAHYTGTLSDGTQFDSSRTENTPFAFTLGRKQVIKGWDEGFALLHVGDQAVFIIPAELAYGGKSVGPIPANSPLKFEVELLEVKDHSAADVIQDAIDKDGVAAAEKRIAQLIDTNFSGYYLNESQLNGLGYHYLKKDKLPEALAVLKLNADLFPKSGNAHDSYGEVLLKKGDKAAALAEYQRARALDPKNDNAAKMIAELSAPASSAK